MNKLCGGCRELLCSHCSQCHNGPVCLWSVSSCQPLLLARALSVDEQRVRRALLVHADRLERLVGVPPVTVDDVRDQRLQAGVLVESALEQVGEVLPVELRQVIGRVLRANEVIWRVDRFLRAREQEAVQ